MPGGSDVFDIFRVLGFSSVVHIPLQRLLRSAAMRTGKDFEGRRVKFFFLSDDEKGKLASAALLQRLQQKPADYDRSSFHCYCHARKIRNNSAMLNDGPLAFRVHLIDTSSLAVLELKRDLACHPVNFVEPKR